MRLKTVILSALALVAFAGNSVLCRLALSGGAIDPASFTSIRLLSGAVTLYVIVAISNYSNRLSTPRDVSYRNKWLAPAMLFAYAALFSFAYVSLDTGIGALVLFGMVQITMVVINYLRGHRMSALEWSGLLVACSGLVYLVYPQLSTPSLLGFVLMGFSGIAWGVYTIEGQGSRNPLVDTSNNFTLSMVFVAVLALLFISQFDMSRQGIAFAVASGAITSGIGYAIWYAALPSLTTAQAGVMQLLVPIIAAIGGVAFAGESLTLRLVISSVLILGGMLLVILSKNRVFAI